MRLVGFNKGVCLSVSRVAAFISGKKLKLSRVILLEVYHIEFIEDCGSRDVFVGVCRTAGDGMSWAASRSPQKGSDKSDPDCYFGGHCSSRPHVVARSGPAPPAQTRHKLMNQGSRWKNEFCNSL